MRVCIKLQFHLEPNNAPNKLSILFNNMRDLSLCKKLDHKPEQPSFEAPPPSVIPLHESTPR